MWSTIQVIDASQNLRMETHAWNLSSVKRELRTIYAYSSSISMYRLYRFFSKKVQLSLNTLRTYSWESKQSYVCRTTIYACCILLVPCPMLGCYHQQKCGVVAPLVVLLLLPSIIVLLWYYKKYKPQAPTRGAFTIAVGGMTMECLLNLINTSTQIHIYIYYICCVTVYVAVLPFLGLISVEGIGCE